MALERLWRRRIAIAASAAAIAGGAMIALGPAAPWVVDHFTDGQRIWRLGRLQLDGVSGSWLGALRAEHVSLADDDGVWFRANDVALDWRPQDILSGHVTINTTHAGRVQILRQPKLSPAQPSSGAGVDVHIGALRVDAIEIGEQTLGETATFTANLSLDLRDDALNSLDVALRRTDSDADHLLVTYRAGPRYLLNVDIDGEAGGILSRVIGAPEKTLRVAANGAGDEQSGEEHFRATLNADELTSGQVQWTPTAWRASTQARLDALPGLSELARRIGPTLAFNANGARVGAFSAHAETPFVSADFTGALDERRGVTGPAHFVATTRRLSDIARECPFALGAARLEGEIRQARGATALRGMLSGAVTEVLGQRGVFGGPISASLNNDGFALAADLHSEAGAQPLLANARLTTDLAYDNHRGRFALNRATFDGGAAFVDARGWARAGDGEFAGAWQSRKLGALLPDLTGAASGQWRAFAARDGAHYTWTTTVSGAGADIGGRDVVAQLLGATPRLDAMLRNERGGITVSHVRIDGAHLRAGAIGRIVAGQADLTLEASAQGPLDLGGATISGAADATGRLTGRLGSPTLTARATLTSFEAGGAVLERPIVDFTLAPGPRAYVGHASAQAAISGNPLTAAADVAIADATLRLTNLDAHAGSLRAQGSAAIGARGASADLALNGSLDGLAPGVSGGLIGQAHLTPEAVALDAQLSNARAGDLWLRAASISANGPYHAIAGHVELRGRWRQAPLTFRGNAAINATHGAVEAQFGGEGTLAGAALATRMPLQMRWSESGLEANLDANLGDGAVAVNWTDRRRALSGSARITDAPLAPLAAIWGETATGRIDGHMTLAHTGGGLGGNADITLTDARLAGRQRGTLNLHIVGDLAPSRLAAQIDATSSDGLIARFEANAPVVTSANPLRVVLTPQRRGTASWSVHGPAESLWAAARLQDQSLEGQLSGEGTLQFGEGSLTGDGHIEIADGRFEDKLSGISLTNLNARILIDQRGVTIDHFQARDPRGGTLTATGGSATPTEGRIAVTVDNVRIADRPEARARASGELTLAWQGLHSTLSGNLNVLEANLDIAANPSSGIPTINVVEINRPDAEDGPPDQGPSIPAPSGADLDVRITAPGRVYTRGRGVDAEWSLDIHLTGSSNAPRIIGMARAIRGTLSLSSQPFDITDATITFDGDPLDARIDLTAERDTSDLTATLRLTGTARNPEISFSSNPALPEDEILPQVLFGHSIQDLSPFEAAQVATSLAALSGRGSLDLVNAARAAAGLDRFNITQDPTGGYLVSGGVYLTRGVYVELGRTGLGQAQTRLEWTIRPRMVLITSFLGNGD
ncbi:MAG: translocation/assembly module TamB domain-containing protein, partial [Proteobacteria bacterium]|nr:translocation/assembly module TamB domain-containing protein [Pseudomonadota bacterium]